MFPINKFIIFSALVLFLYFAPSVEAAVLSLNPPSSSVYLGEEFDVQVRIDTQGAQVTSADVLLGYDKYLLDVISVTKGINGQNSFFPDFFQSVDSDFSRIYMGALVASPGNTRIGQGVIGTIRFKSKTAGDAIVGFHCQSGQTNETNITLADKNATDIVNCLALNNVYYVVSQNPISLRSIQLHAVQKTAAIGKGSLGLSALAYDQNNLPIWNGVTYEWGVSSSNSVGSVNPIFGTITNFLPLNPGIGDVFVTARMGTQMQTAGVQITVTALTLVAGDVNGDGHITLVDLSTLLANFGIVNATRNQGDVNGDGRVNLQDLSILLSNFGR